MKTQRMLHLLYTLLFTALLTTTLVAQGTGRLAGRVTDSAGKGLPDADVRLTTSSGQTERTTSGADGSFTFETLPFGSYQVEILSAGKTQKGGRPLELNADSTTTLELVFMTDYPADSSKPAEVVIRAVAPTVQVDSAEVSRSYVTRTVRSIPVSDRQYQDFIGLMPGVTPPATTVDRVVDPQRTRIYNVNGQPDYANTHLQDGHYQREGYSGQPMRVSPLESIQQLDVRTSNFNAEHGFAGGGFTNAVTRPGTNNGVHGSVFGLTSNRFLTTRNALNTSTSNPGFNTHQFGGTIGGPIVKDKTFFLLAYEGYLRRGSILSITSVPSDDLRAGNFSQIPGFTLFDPASGNSTGMGRSPFTGNRIPVNRLNPISQTILGQLPLANQSGLVNNLVGGVPQVEDLHRGDGKIDHRFSERATGFFRYGFTQGSVNRGSLLGPLGDAAESGLRNHNGVASYTHSVTPTLAGEIRLGYSRYRNAIFAVNTSPQLDADLARLGFTNGLPQIAVGGFGTIGLPGNYPSKAVNNTYDAATNWNWHNGMHHLKFGVQAVDMRSDGFDAGIFSPRGTFIFGSGATASPAGMASQLNPALNGFGAFLAGTPTLAGVSSFQQTPTYRQRLLSGYLTDTVNLWQWVSLELGARYDYYTQPETRLAGAATIFDPLTNQISQNGRGSFDMSGNAEKDLNNIAPRIGIVARPIERLAIRAGYAIHYFPAPFALSAINQAALSAQLGTAGGFGTTAFAVPQNRGAITEGSTALNQPFSVTSTDNETPYVQTFSLNLQGDLGNGFLMDAGYVGTLGRQLPYNRNLNVALPGTGLSGLPFAAFNRTAAVNYRGNGLNNNYNSMQVNLTKRFGAGLSFSGAYTWSKALDTGFDQSNPFNTGDNYGPSDYDRKHVLAISHLWQLPFGAGSQFANSGWLAQVLGNWEINGLLRWATGTPYTVTADPLLCNCAGATATRAAFTGDASSFDGQNGFSAGSFSSPAAGSFGVQGRNSFRGPEFFTYNTALFRNFPFRENYKLELRAEVYNVTNTTNYSNPISSLTSPGFGRSTSTLNGMLGRQFQVGARILF